jgi:hypothetical protein
MNRVIVFLFALLSSISLVYAAEVKVTLSQDKDGASPASEFTADTPKLFAIFNAEGVKSGDKLRGVWIAEDVGDVAPKGSKIDEATVNAEGDGADGTFSLSKPSNGWPTGKYKLEVYVNEKLANTTNFTIAASKNTKPVPGNDELKSLAESSIIAFGEAVNDKDFSGFYLDIADMWQEQTSAEKLQESFKDFFDKDIDLPAAIKGMEPVFDKPATIDSNGVLLVGGYYPTKPNRIVFQLKYITQEQEWKLFGIHVVTKE